MWFWAWRTKHYFAFYLTSASCWTLPSLIWQPKYLLSRFVFDYPRAYLTMPSQYKLCLHIYLGPKCWPLQNVETINGKNRTFANSRRSPPPSNGTFPDISLPFFLLHFNPRTLHLVKIENIIVKSFGSNWTLLGCSDHWLSTSCVFSHILIHPNYLIE